MPKTKTALARSVADAWVRSKAQPTFRVVVYTVEPDDFVDLAVQALGSQVDALQLVSHADKLQFYSSSREALSRLEWLAQKQGLETTGII